MNIRKLKRLRKKYFKSTEEVVSMFLGLVIVVVVFGLIFNFFQRKKGNIAIPGSNNIEIVEREEDIKNQYIVSKGDSLWKIAEEKYNDGYKWVEIAEENNLDNPGVLLVGQKLLLPKIESDSLLAITDQILDKSNDMEVESEYVVVKGDSLWKIAVRAYSDGYQWVKIWQRNGDKLVNPNGLEIGMFLVIPELK